MAISAKKLNVRGVASSVRPTSGIVSGAIVATGGTVAGVNGPVPPRMPVVTAGRDTRHRLKRDAIRSFDARELGFPTRDAIGSRSNPPLPAALRRRPP